MLPWILFNNVRLTNTDRSRTPSAPSSLFSLRAHRPPSTAWTATLGPRLPVSACVTPLTHTHSTTLPPTLYHPTITPISLSFKSSVFVCVCVCVRARARVCVDDYHGLTYFPLLRAVCVRVCACVCVVLTTVQVSVPEAQAIITGMKMDSPSQQADGIRAGGQR
jgi:hypothetical protein